MEGGHRSYCRRNVPCQCTTISHNWQHWLPSAKRVTLRSRGLDCALRILRPSPPRGLPPGSLPRPPALTPRALPGVRPQVLGHEPRAARPQEARGSSDTSPSRRRPRRMRRRPQRTARTESAEPVAPECTQSVWADPGRRARLGPCSGCPREQSTGRGGRTTLVIH